jgi:hypothetical protein
MTFLQLGFFRLTSGFDGFSKMSADVCPDRLHYPTAIAYRPMERTGLRARKTSSPCDQADEGRKVKIIPRRQACPQVTSPLSSECRLWQRQADIGLGLLVTLGIPDDPS